MSPKNPKVTVVIPAFNAAAFIAESIKSIIVQTYKNIEIIVVDDCSTDDTKNIVLQIKDERLRLIQQTKNSGYAACINKALTIATGDYIARMDATDISHPTRIEKQLRLFESYPDAAFVSCNRYRITPGGVKFKAKKENDNGVSFVSWDNIMTNERSFADPGTITEKEKLLKVGGYRTYQRSGMDVDLWLRLLEKYEKGVICNELLYGYRLEVSSIVFNPLTNFNNKLPRILARQRKDFGSEDFKIAKNEQNKNVPENGNENDYRTLIGISATCLSLLDIKGFIICFQEQKKKSGHFRLLETIKKAVSRKIHIQKIAKNNLPL